MVKVLIVDDSAVVRQVLAEQLSKADGIEVVGTAVDPYIARDKIVALSPDVVTLDLEMPRMDGLTFLRKLVRYRPLPVIVVSSLTPAGSEAALQAMRIGAVDVVAKPGSAYSVKEISKRLARMIRAAAKAHVSAPLTGQQRPTNVGQCGVPLRTTHKVLAIGASTGGTRAIEDLMLRLPPDTPGTVIVQHMPENFTKGFAARLHELSAMEVYEAQEGSRVVTGCALVAPGNVHMVLKRSGAEYLVSLKDGPPVHYQRPSVDVLFHSVAREAGRNAVGVILTGMGADGAAGLLAMRTAGARTFAEDERSCVVFGMPKAAIERGAAEQVVPLDALAARVMETLAQKATPAAET